MEPNTDLVPCEARDSEVPDSSPDSEPPAPLPIESCWAPIMEFTAEDIFQHSPFGDILNSLRYLSLSGVPWPDYGQDGWDADDEEIQSPPTTHFVATVDDLTDMLDYDSEDINGMDDDAGDDQEPAPTGHWKASSSYDIYMVDIPKDGMAMEQQRKTPPRNSLSANVSGAALNPATARMEIPAPETTTPLTVPKTTPSSKIQHRRTQKPALTRERQTKR